MNNDPDRTFRCGPKLEVRLPARISTEAAYLLADVLEQLMAQLFEHFEDEITSEIIRLNNVAPEPPLPVVDPDLPF